MKKIFNIFFIMMALNWCEFALGEDITETVRRVSKSLESVKECAEKGVTSCERDLGIFYSYNIVKENKKVSSSRDVVSAKLWLFKAIKDPLAKFSIGKLILENEKQPIYQLMAGETFLIISCNDGSMEACIYLANMYHKIGPKKLFCDEKTCDKSLNAIRSIIKKAKANNNLSSYEKEEIYADYSIRLARILIEKNDFEAVKILEDAVARDVTWSTTTLAPVYAKGELAPKDLVRAYMLYDLSGTGYADEKAKIAEEMTPVQIQQAKEMSWRWQDEHRSYRPGYRDSDMGVQWQGVRYH